MIVIHFYRFSIDFQILSIAFHCFSLISFQNIPHCALRRVEVLPDARLGFLAFCNHSVTFALPRSRLRHMTGQGVEAPSDVSPPRKRTERTCIEHKRITQNSAAQRSVAQRRRAQHSASTFSTRGPLTRFVDKATLPVLVRSGFSRRGVSYCKK